MFNVSIYQFPVHGSKPEDKSQVFSKEKAPGTWGLMCIEGSYLQITGLIGKTGTSVYNIFNHKLLT